MKEARHQCAWLLVLLVLSSLVVVWAERTQRCPYEVLGISRDSDTKTIKTAYRRLSLKFHPDKNKGDSGAQAKFLEVSSAYEILSDPQKRRDYDQFGFGGGGGDFHFDPFGGGGGFDPFELFRKFHGDGFDPFGDFGSGAFEVDLESMFGGDPFGGDDEGHDPFDFLNGFGGHPGHRAHRHHDAGDGSLQERYNDEYDEMGLGNIMDMMGLDMGDMMGHDERGSHHGSSCSTMTSCVNGKCTTKTTCN